MHAKDRMLEHVRLAPGGQTIAGVIEREYLPDIERETAIAAICRFLEDPQNTEKLDVWLWNDTSAEDIVIPWVNANALRTD